MAESPTCRRRKLHSGMLCTTRSHPQCPPHEMRPEGSKRRYTVRMPPNSLSALRAALFPHEPRHEEAIRCVCLGGSPHAQRTDWTCARHCMMQEGTHSVAAASNQTIDCAGQTDRLDSEGATCMPYSRCGLGRYDAVTAASIAATTILAFACTRAANLE